MDKKVVEIVDPGHMFDRGTTLGHVSVPADMDMAQQQQTWISGLTIMTEQEWRDRYPTFLAYLLTLDDVERADVETYVINYPYG